MTLEEYFESFEKYVVNDNLSPRGFSLHVAAEVAAAHEIGLSFEQLKKFLARRTAITSVAICLKGPRLSATSIQRILNARKSGAIYPSEVLAQAFSKDEIREKYLSESSANRAAGELTLGIEPMS